MDLNWLSAMLVGAGCLTLGYCFGTRRPSFIFVRLTPKVVKYTKTNPSSHHGNKKNMSKEPFEIDKLADILDDFKMVLVVRNDLKMGKGKIAAQCSHATLGLYKMLLNRAPTALNSFKDFENMQMGDVCSAKSVVKIESEEDMLVLQERAKSLKLPTHITIDAGRTQIAPISDSRTVMAILGPVEVVDEVTGGLKLL